MTYRPNTNFAGTDAFTFTVRDGSTTSAPATFGITVTPVNDPPVALSASVTVPEDGSVAVPEALRPWCGGLSEIRRG